MNKEHPTPEVTTVEREVIMITININYKNGKKLTRRCHSVEEDEKSWCVAFPTSCGMPELVIYRKNEQIEKIEILD